MRVTFEIRQAGRLSSVWFKRALPLVLVPALMFAGPVLASHPPFTDVPSSNPHHNDIEAIRAAGITSGCTPTTYCPADFVRRDQLASFLARVAGLGTNPPKANADRLDGFNSSAFVQGAANVRKTIMDVAPGTTELSVPLDWLRFQYQCPASATDPGSLSFVSSLAAMTYFIDTGATNPTVGTRPWNVFGGFVSASDPADMFTIQVETVTRLATVWVTSQHLSDKCLVRIQAVVERP